MFQTQGHNLVSLAASGRQGMKKITYKQNLKMVCLHKYTARYSLAGGNLW